MDIVQRQEARRRLIAANVWPIWTQFKAGLKELLVSYESSERAPGWSAQLTSVHDRSIVVAQNRGVARDGYHNRRLSITVSIHENSFIALVALIEDYMERDGKHVSLGKRRLEYGIDANLDSGEVYLTKGDTRLSPSEAAENLIAETILKEDA